MSVICHATLPSPDELKKELPAPPISHFQATAANILRGKESRIAILLGPCSIHKPEEAIDFGKKLVRLQGLLSSFFLIMRVFFEKPRSRLGWKGLMYDPFLDGSNDLQEGLRSSRKLLLELNTLKIPCATEFLQPLIAPYLSDLITWGLIGARTSASQPHRQLASGLPFPVGFKNGVYGELEPALNGIISAQMPHTHFSIDQNGRLAMAETTGSTLAHLVLRGSKDGPNCNKTQVDKALELLKEQHLEPRLAIDCSHGNSRKDPNQQKWAFETAIDQIASGNQAIRALMLESNLFLGTQPMREDPERLQYGISITDACLGWEETEELLLSAEGRLRPNFFIENRKQKSDNEVGGACL